MQARNSETLICIGDSIKAIGDTGKVGGYLVRFSSKEDRDIDGEFFTERTYFGARDGDGADTFFHHARPLKNGLEALADHIFKPIKTARDQIGIWAETVLDLADQYERAVYEMVAAGKLGWSSGTATHLIKKAANGEITRWPIVEGSLTPTPAEPRNRASAVKTLEALIEDEAQEIKAAFEAATTERTFEKALRDAGLSRKTAEIVLGRAKAIFQGEPEELAVLKRDLAEKTAQLLQVRTELLLAQHPIPNL